jgi:hypothetical protein
MADYYSLLARAVAALPQSTPEARRSVYDRARKALVNQLRSIQPPVAEADIDAEGRALDEAVARLEAEAAAKSAPKPPPPPPFSPLPMRPAVAPPPPVRPAPPAGVAAPAKPPLPKPPSSKPEPPKKPPGPEPPLTEAEKAVASRNAFLERKKAEAAAWRGSLGQSETPALPDREEPGPREQQRPAAPLPPMPEAPSGSRRILAIAAILVVLVGVVALAAWKLRESPEDLAKLKPEDAATESQVGGKFAERVQGDDAPATDGRGGSEARGPAVPVAQKAELWVGSVQEPNKVEKIYPASVVWRLETVGGGPGEPVGSAIRGDVDAPDAKLKMTLVIRKNLDATLSATHTVNISFKIAPGSDLKAVKAIFPIQMRRLEAQSGEKIAGIPVPITENNFLIGLMRGDHEPRNLMLLRSLMVMDVPFQLVDGRAATINMEKGASGERVFADALAAWGQK